jgi:hypothetical protein
LGGEGFIERNKNNNNIAIDAQPEEVKLSDKKSNGSRNPLDYLNFPEVPIIEPSEEEFNEPLLLIRKL